MSDTTDHWQRREPIATRIDPSALETIERLAEQRRATARKLLVCFSRMVHGRWQSIQLDKKPAVVVRQPGSAPHFTPQNYQLMSERRVLGFKPALRLERRSQDGHYET
jgi:hypothetical protein